MNTKPIDGTLLAAFTRFADLSCYWHRHGTPDSLAVNELQERTRLAVDIPEMIRRLNAFAELGTDAMFERYASARAEPPKEVAKWREIKEGEIIAGDQIQRRGFPEWNEAKATIGMRVEELDPQSWVFRRRIAKEPPKDTVWHNVPENQEKREETAIPAQENSSGEQWRMLEKGEVIKSGDQYEDEDCGWTNTNIVGCEYSGVFLPHRRRIAQPVPAQEPSAGDGWRWMEPGEIIEKDDMVHSSPVTPKYEHVIGCPVAEGQFHIYRRRTPTKEQP